MSKIIEKKIQKMKERRIKAREYEKFARSPIHKIIDRDKIDIESIIKD